MNSPIPSMLPRADVSTGALAAALIGILLAVMNGGEPSTGATLDGLAPLVTVVVTFAAMYLLPAPHKQLAGAIGGAVVVVVFGLIVFERTGSFADEATFNGAAVYLLNLVLTFFIPASQPPMDRLSGTSTSPTRGQRPTK